MNLTKPPPCEVWVGETQCGQPAVARWLSVNPHLPEAREILVCELHEERIHAGRLWRIKE